MTDDMRLDVLKSMRSRSAQNALLGGKILVNKDNDLIGKIKFPEVVRCNKMKEHHIAQLEAELFKKKDNGLVGEINIARCQECNKMKERIAKM